MRAVSASALERPRVSIDIVGCDAALAREAQRIAAIELRATLVDPAPDGTVTEVKAACRGVLAALEAGRALGARRVDARNEREDRSQPACRQSSPPNLATAFARRPFG